jgi:hypothetical protein
LDHECEGGLLWKNQHADVGERKGCQGVKRMEVCYVYIIRQYNETHKALFEKWGKEKGANGNIMYAVNLFNIHCIHV